ncbi:dihydrolipoamide acetyltransferase family protein [Longirhabdus pacifica]|uniref:dihydrolipoamide acetyltransferase family protein n=1 Tax=Longirhabdus pacifica TaxID=2305227 RepID=UPI001008A0E3|nr:dihydrolipoamide acetyltransferase family protein [Longirhabdus pacifica]
MALFEYKFPELGEGLSEGEIVEWHIKPGDDIEEDQIIMEVQNDKAVVEVPSPVTGKVAELKVEDGTVCTVGDIVATFEVEGDAAAGEASTTEEAPAEECAVGSSVAENVAKATIETAPATSAPVNDIGEVDTSKILATPSVRKLARDKGINIAQITGTGKNGKITKEDVEAFASGGSTTAAAAPVASENKAAASASAPATQAAPEGDFPEERVPLKGIRKIIANSMVKSVYTAPHVTIMDEVDVTALVELRKKAKPLAEQKGVKLTYLPFIVKALVAAVRQFPALNASIDDDNNEIVYKKYYNIGIATDTDNGLIVPVIEHADRKNIWTIADKIKDLAVRGREGKLAPNEMKGSSISITNIGSAGGMFFTPVINHPEVAILGTGRISEKPIVKDGEITVGQMMNLSLSFDHRLIDGATAQYAMNYMKQLLSDPQMLIMEV